MKKLFTAIRRGELELVKVILKKNPILISCVAKQPPKKDDGQSPLQVAIKSGNFEIADYLLDLGADVNFMELESCNRWKMPVIQDAIMAAIMCSKFIKSYNGKNLELLNNKKKVDQSFNILKRMFDLGADINCHDSYDNSCLGRAILDARQILPSYSHTEKKIIDNNSLNIEQKENLVRIFELLLLQGADINEIDPKFEQTLLMFYKDEPVGQFIQELLVK